ncbi:unnamed protein product [Parajaminaea phylloscopi]
MSNEVPPDDGDKGMPGVSPIQEEDEEGDQDHYTGRWPYKTLPPSHDSPVFWSASTPFSTVREGHGTSMVHVDQVGRVTHVGLRDPVNDKLKSSRMLSEAMMHVWTKRNLETEEREEAEHQRRHSGQGLRDTSIAGIGATMYAASEDLAADLPVRSVQKTGRVDSPHTDSDCTVNSDSPAPIVITEKPQAVTPSRFSAAVLDAEHQKLIRQKYFPPWRVRVLGVGTADELTDEATETASEAGSSPDSLPRHSQYLGSLQSEDWVEFWDIGMGERESLNSALTGAWAVFSSAFDGEGFPRQYPEDWHLDLVDAVIAKGVDHLVVCSVIDSPKQSEQSLPACMRYTRRLLSHAQLRGDRLLGFTHLPMSLAFETAHEHKLFDIVESAPTSWTLAFRYPTALPLPWSSIKDVGPAVLMAWHKRRIGSIDGSRECKMVSDCLSGLEMRAQCLQLIYIANRTLTVKAYTLEQWRQDSERAEAASETANQTSPSDDTPDFFSKTWGRQEARRLLDFWLRYRFDSTLLLKHRIGADMTHGAEEHRLTGWSNWALARIDVLFPGWNTGLNLVTSSILDSDSASNDRLTRLLPFEDEEDKQAHRPRLLRIQDAISSGESLVAQSLSNDGHLAAFHY